MPSFAVVIPAAGASSRFTGFVDKKPFASLLGRPVWLRTVEHFTRLSDVSEVVLVIAPDDLNEFRERFRPNLAFLDLNIAVGGASRAESVQNGISALKNDADFIAVHDAARPLLTDRFIRRVFDAAVQHDAVIPAVPVTSTVKEIDSESRIVRTVERSNLVLAQTPQVFRADLLRQAFSLADDPSVFTDEASLVEAGGNAVFVCEGWSQNLKITTAEDFHLAQTLLESQSADSQAKDLSPFADDRFR